MEQYTGRHEETLVVTKVTDGSIEYEGSGHGMFDEVRGKVAAGDTVVLETKGFSQVTGMRPVDGDWWFHKTDDDLAREHKEMLAKWDEERREALKVNRVDWQAREDALPDWLRDRIATFHQKGGESFELRGWGYELCVCELAALYDEDGFDEGEDSRVMQYARKYGTSGNQHDFAKALVRAHREGMESAGDTVSALSPITGDGFYEGTN